MSQSLFPASPDPFRSAIEDVNAALVHQPDVAARIVGLLIDAAQAQAEYTVMREEWLAGMRLTRRVVNRLLADQQEPPVAAPKLRHGRATIIPFAVEARHA